MINIIKLTIAKVLLFSLFTIAQNQAPVVDNVSFTQRTDDSFIVDIYYDVNDADNDTMYITMLVSNDAGATFNFAATTISGDVGDSIASGTEKHIVWDFGKDHPNYSSDQIQIKIIANDDYGNGSETDLEKVTAALETSASADSLYRAILVTQGRGGAVTATINYLNSLGTVIEAGMSPDSSVYVFYENGLLGCVYNPDLGPSQANSQSMKKRNNTRSGGEATAISYVLLPFADEFGDESEMDVVDMLEECFGSEEPITEVYKNDQVTLEKVTQVLSSSPGVLFWSGHGTLIPKKPGSQNYNVALMTGKSYTSGAIADKILNSYKSQTLGGTNREIVVVAHEGKHYLSVLPAFVSSNADFDKLEGMGHNATKSTVYICCCYSANYELAKSFTSAGADAYFGWNNEVMTLFASQKHKKFFKEATDTSTLLEAYSLFAEEEDPKTGAMLDYDFVDGNIMIRAKVKMNRNGVAINGYSILVDSADVTSVTCWTDPHEIIKTTNVQISFPGIGPGSFNCVSNENAVISVVQMATGKAFIVEKGLTGVNGNIIVKRNGNNILSGEFSGTLGYWLPGLDPSKDPPSETMSIENGIFKHTGLRY